MILIALTLADASNLAGTLRDESKSCMLGEDAVAAGGAVVSGTFPALFKLV
jgi:hypothetical protein